MQLEAGKYYRTRKGYKRYCVGYDQLSKKWVVSDGRGYSIRCSDGRFDKIDDETDLVAEWADPAPQPARQPLDLSKPIVSIGGVTGGAKLASVKSDGIRIKYYLSPSEWYTCDLDGYSNGVQVLRQAVAKPWTQADVPFPWPVFRRKNCHSTQCGVVLTEPDIIRIRSAGDLTYNTLSKDWEYTTDGKTWQECCKWE